MRGLVVLVTLACFANAQHQALIDYLERRLLAIEVRPPFTSLPSPALPLSPLRGNSEGQGTRQWNADVGKSRGKMLENTDLLHVYRRLL